MYALRTLAWPEHKKRGVKINYFVVDAGRGIDRPPDRIKSRAGRLPFFAFPFYRCRADTDASLLLPSSRRRL